MSIRAGLAIYPNTDAGRKAASAWRRRNGKEAVLGKEVPEERKRKADPGSEGEGQSVSEGGGKAVSKPRGQRKGSKG